MAWGIFSRGARVTGQTATNVATQAGTFTTARMGGGTRTERVFHARFVDFFRSCVRKISPRKHRFLAQGTDTKSYLLSRKNDPGNLRLSLVGRLRNPALSAALTSAAGATDPTNPEAIAADTSITAAVQSDGPDCAHEPTPRQRIESIRARGPRIHSTCIQLYSGDPALRLQARADSARLISEILDDFRILTAPDMTDLSSEYRAAVRELLTRQLIDLKLPEGSRRLAERESNVGLAAAEGDGTPSVQPSDRYRYLPPPASADETLEARRARGDSDWPSPIRAPGPFVQQIADLLSHLAGSASASDREPVDPRLIDRIFEQARIQASSHRDNAPPEIDADDSLYQVRQLVWMLAVRGQHAERDDQLRRVIESRLMPAPEAPTEHLSEAARAQARERAKIHAENLVASRPILGGEIDRRLPLARLEAYCDEVDRLFGADASIDESRLRLKLSATTDDGQRELINRRHSLSLSMRNLERAWTIRTRRDGRQQSPFVAGSQVRLDEKLLKALTTVRTGQSINTVKSTNTRDVNLLIAHAIALQKAADEQAAWLDSGAEGVVDDPPSDNGADRVLSSVFDARDLRAMGFSDEDLSRMQEDGAIEGLLDASRALAAAGLGSASGIAQVNALIAGARSRLIDNSLATQGLRDLAGAEARAEALVAIARAGEASRATLVASLGSYLRSQVTEVQQLEYERAGSAIANAYDDRLAIDRDVAAARKTLESLATQPASITLDPTDLATRELALKLDEFRQFSALLTSTATLKARLQEAIDSSDDPDIQRSLKADLDTAAEQLNGLHQAQLDAMRSLARRTDHPLLAPHASAFRNAGFLNAGAWLQSAESGASAPARQVLDAVDAIIAIDGSADRIQLCETRMRDAARVQTAILESRRDTLPGPQRAALRLELRSIAASLYLEHLQAAAGQATSEYVLANDRERFIAQARERGIPVEDFAIEIDDMLVRELSEEALGQWISDTQATFTDRMLAAVSQMGASTAALRGIPGPNASSAERQPTLKVAPDTPTLANAHRATILGAVRQMQIGDRVFLKASRTGEIGLSRIPADPSSSLKLDLMVGVGDRNVFDIKRKPNGNFTISIREGTTLSARAGLSASPSALGEIAKLSGKVQLNHTDVAGIALEFPPDKATTFIEHVLENKPVDAKLLASAKDIRAISKNENKILLEAAIGVSTDGVAKAIEKHSPQAAKVLRAGLDSKSMAMPSLGVSAKAVWSRGWAEASQKNAKAVVMKRATTYQSEVGASVGLTGKLPSMTENVIKPAQPEASQGASYDPLAQSLGTPAANIATLQWTASRVYEAELAVEQQALDGSLRKAEFEFVVPLVPGLDTSALGAVDSRLRTQLERMTPEQRAEFDRLLNKVDNYEGYVLLATSQLDESDRDALNADFDGACEMARDIARKHSAKSGATALDQACQVHGERLAGLESRAADFKLQRLILVKGATMTRDQAFSIGIARIARQGQAGTGNTVGQVDLTAKPTSEKAATALPANDDSTTVASGEDEVQFFDSRDTLTERLSGAVARLRDGVQGPEQVMALLQALQRNRVQGARDANQDPVVRIRAGLLEYEGFGQAPESDALVREVQRRVSEDSLLLNALQTQFRVNDLDSLLKTIRDRNPASVRAELDRVDQQLIAQLTHQDDVGQERDVSSVSSAGSPGIEERAGRLIREAGLSTQPVAGDGHCMFASLAHAHGGDLRNRFQADSIDAAMQVRERLLRFAASVDPEQLKAISGSEDTNRQQNFLTGAYLELARGFNVDTPAQEGWGTALSLPLAAMHFDRTLLVVDEGGRIDTFHPDGTRESVAGASPGTLADHVTRLRSQSGPLPMMIYKSSPAHFQSVEIPD